MPGSEFANSDAEGRIPDEGRTREEKKLSIFSGDRLQQQDEKMEALQQENEELQSEVKKQEEKLREIAKSHHDQREEMQRIKHQAASVCRIVHQETASHFTFLNIFVPVSNFLIIS